MVSRTNTVVQSIQLFHLFCHHFRSYESSASSSSCMMVPLIPVLISAMDLFPKFKSDIICQPIVLPKIKVISNSLFSVGFLLLKIEHGFRFVLSQSSNLGF